MDKLGCKCRTVSHLLEKINIIYIVANWYFNIILLKQAKVFSVYVKCYILCFYSIPYFFLILFILFYSKVKCLKSELNTSKAVTLVFCMYTGCVLRLEGESLLFPQREKREGCGWNWVRLMREDWRWERVYQLVNLKTVDVEHSCAQHWSQLQLRGHWRVKCVKISNNKNIHELFIPRVVGRYCCWLKNNTK